MATKLIDMGVSQKELYPSEGPATTKKESENRKVHPTLSLDGPHAEMMGAEELKEGDTVEQTVRWKVKSHSKTTENGKTRFRMELSLQAASDCQEYEGDDEKEKKDEDEDDEKESPAMAYITGRNKSD